MTRMTKLLAITGMMSKVVYGRTYGHSDGENRDCSRLIPCFRFLRSVHTCYAFQEFHPKHNFLDGKRFANELLFCFVSMTK